MEKITSFKEAKHEIARHRLDGIVARDHKCPQDVTQIASCYGGVFHGRAIDKWPTNNDRPLIPWLQIVARDLPTRLRPFDRFELVSFFIDPETWDDDFAKHDHHSIVVRAYESLDDLVPLDRPETLPGHPHYRLEWVTVDDFPCLSHFYEKFDNGVYDQICEDADKLSLDNKSGIKISGWPTLVQRDYDLLLTDSYLMQIDMTENYMYGDSGVAYVYFNPDDRWMISFDCC